MNFSGNGYHVSFDANGDPVAFYELINWQKNPNGGLEFVTVGLYDESLPSGQKFNIRKKSVGRWWHTGREENIFFVSLHTLLYNYV